MNATPSAAAPASSHALRPVSPARTTSSSASTISAIITASIVSLREVITSIGSTAIASAAAIPAGALHMRRTAAYSSGTEAIPANASGSFSVVEEKPSSFTLATCSHRSTGGLSIETLPAGLERAEEEVVQGQRHAAHGGVVERVGRTPCRYTAGAAPPRRR